MGLLGLETSTEELGRFCTCQNSFGFSKVSSQSRTNGKALEELLHYLESGPEAVDVAGVTQRCLEGVGDHTAHAAPGALGHLGCLGVGDQRIADGFRQQFWVSKDENPGGAAGWGKGEMQIHITDIRAGRSCSCLTFSIVAVDIPLFHLSPCQWQLPASQNREGHRRNMPSQCKLLVRYWVSPSWCPSHGLGPNCLFQPRLILGVGKGQVSLRDHKMKAPSSPKRQHSLLLVGERGTRQALLRDDHSLVQGSWEGQKHMQWEQQKQCSSQ